MKNLTGSTKTKVRQTRAVNRAWRMVSGFLVFLLHGWCSFRLQAEDTSITSMKTTMKHGIASRSRLIRICFRDRVVVIGAQPMPGQFNERGDEWRSPFVDLNEADRFMPGAEVHATQLINLLRADWLRRASPANEGILWCLFGLVVGTVVIVARPVWGIPIVAVIALAFGWISASASAMSGANLWTAWLVPVMVQTPLAIAGGLTWHSMDWYRARQRAMRRIREQAELIDKAQDAILLFDLNGELKSANPRAREIFGFTNDRPQPVDFWSDSATTAKRAVVESGRWQGELKHFGNGDEALILASRWTLIRDEHQVPTGILVINTDVTEQKRLEAQLIRAQRMEVVGNIAGSMAHDLNNSLAPVLMGVQMLKRRHWDGSTRRTLEHIESSAQRSVQMVRQVIVVARGRVDETGQIDPDLLIREMTRLARETFPKTIRVESQVARDLWPVEGNSTQLHQVLLNLCVNARDAMPDGGTLTIAADNVVIEDAELMATRDARPGEFVSIMVNDTGTGISSAYLRHIFGMSSACLPHIFEAFFTTKPEGKGTGLGLPTVKRIVEAHSGFIQSSSTAEEGTTFEVFLPKSLETRLAPAESRQADTNQGRGRSVVVVEHAAAIRELLGETLATLGYQVLMPDTPSEALEHVATGRWNPDALIIGLNHPGIEGLNLFAAFRRHLPNVPAILLGDASLLPPTLPPVDATFLNSAVNASELLSQLSRILLNHRSH